jgi:TadE-like protein
MSRLVEPGRRTETGGSSEIRGPIRDVRRGQSLAEFALVLPVLLLIVLFAIDAGRLFLGWVEINNAARIAANYASLHPTADWSDPADPDRLRFNQLIAQEATVVNCTLESPVPEPTYPSGTDLGDLAEAHFSCAFDVLTPLIGNVIGDPLTIGASSTFPIRTGSILGTPLGTSIPSPTDSPDPGDPCVADVPDFVTGTTTVSQAQTQWTALGFTGSLTKITPPNNNYDIGWQSLPVGPQPCDSSISVAKNAP